VADDHFLKVPGRLMRTLKTGRLSGLVGGSYIGGKLLDRFKDKGDAEKAQMERHLKNARRIVETMAELRGPMMKVGQLLSTHAEALPQEVVDILSALQSKAPPMPWAEVRQQVFAELGAWPEEVFASFEPEAFAAASIGQVHRGVAEVDEGGTTTAIPVAVKVQYPAADGMVESDLRNLSTAIGLVKGVASDVIGQEKLDFTPVYEEIGEHMRQETDYCREAYNAQLMRAVLADQPDVVVPRVFNAFSSFRVITYEFVEGQPLAEFLKSGATAEQRRAVTERLARSFWAQIFEAGIMHADPHPGNYLIMEDGRIALLDFGCVKIFSERWVSDFTRLVRAYIDGDEAEERAAILALELVGEGASEEEMADMRKIGHYFSAGLLADEPFRFGAEFDYVGQGKDLIRHFLRARRVPRSHQDFIFLTRVALGLYEYFSQLDAPVNYHRIAWPFIEHGWQGRKVAIPDYYLE